jgi:hypothetical protein
MTYKCKCGEPITLPSQEAVSIAFREMGFEGEVILKQPCPRCKRRQATNYAASNGVKSIDKHNI